MGEGETAQAAPRLHKTSGASRNTKKLAKIVDFFSSNLYEEPQ
jgi:hypothetical protein